MLTLSRLTDCQLYGSAGHRFSLAETTLEFTGGRAWGNHPMFEFLALSRQSKYRTVLCSQTSGRKNKLEDTGKSCDGRKT